MNAIAGGNRRPAPACCVVGVEVDPILPGLNGSGLSSPAREGGDPEAGKFGKNLPNVCRVLSKVWANLGGFRLHPHQFLKIFIHVANKCSILLKVLENNVAFLLFKSHHRRVAGSKLLFKIRFWHNLK